MQEQFNFVFNYVFIWINTSVLHVSVHDLHACFYKHVCVCVGGGGDPITSHCNGVS